MTTPTTTFFVTIRELDTTPHGCPNLPPIEIDASLGLEYQDMRRAGFGFTAQLLMNGKILVDVGNTFESVDMAVVESSTQVQDALEGMLRSGQWRKEPSP